MLFAELPAGSELQLFVEADGTYRVYDGFFSFDDFPIAPGGELQDGTGLLIKVPSDFTWIVVGSHKDNKQIPLYQFTSGTHTGFNWRSIAYHTTQASASGLWAELGSDVEIQTFVEANGTYRVYDGFFSFDDFPIVPGKPLLIKVPTTRNWTAAHY